MKIGIWGIGYVGLVTALCLSKSGFDVICVDNDVEKINRLKKGEPTIYEKGIHEILEEAIRIGSIYFTDNNEYAVDASDVIFICVGTPTVNNMVNLTNVYKVVDTIAAHSNTDKVVVIKSTVPIGTNSEIQQMLNNTVRNSHIHISVVSNPEFLREGTAIKDFLYPDRVIIGSSHLPSIEIMKGIYEKVVPELTPVIVTDTKTSELIKYASNAFLATKISFINEIANLCGIMKANILDVEYALGLDKRIAPGHLKAGPGFGGGCLPKDLEALIEIGNQNNYNMTLCKAVEHVNVNQIEFLIQLLSKECNGLTNKRIALWGVTFKSNTNDVRRSPASTFVNTIIVMGARLSIYDPMGMINFQSLFPKDEFVQYFDDKYDALDNADAFVILSDWDEFKDIQFTEILKRLKFPLIFDFKKLYLSQKNEIENLGFHYKGVGCT